MLSPLLFAIALMAPSDPIPVGPSSLGAGEPPVRLWLNGDRRFEPGDRARVQVEARDDGYLLVLNYDTDGRVRVLFPLEPQDDGFVRGGRRYEVRSEEDRASFVVGEGGAGFVFVALSPDPWQVRSWARGGRWDYDVVTIDSRSEDPEREFTRLLEGVSSSRGFDYDLVEYFVADVEIVRYEYGHRFGGPGVFVGLDPLCDPYWESGWYCGGRSGAYLSYGRSYLGSWWSIGYGPSWYWPSAWDYRYRPYAYGPGSYRYTYHRPWVTYAPTYRPRPGQPILAGRSRGYDVDRYTPWSFDAINRATGGARPASRDADNYRPRGESGRARPAPEREATSEAGRGRPAVDRAPAAGRARPATRPADRPSADRGPSRAPASQPARSRGRSRGGEEDLAFESREAPPGRGVAQDGPRARSVRPSPPVDRGPDVRQAAPRRDAPRASQPEARREAPQGSRPAARREAPPADRAAPKQSSPPSERRVAPQGRSRGGDGRRGN